MNTNTNTFAEKFRASLLASWAAVQQTSDYDTIVSKIAKALYCELSEAEAVDSGRRCFRLDEAYTAKAESTLARALVDAKADLGKFHRKAMECAAIECDRI